MIRRLIITGGCVALSGCATHGMTADDFAKVAAGFKEAGCSGELRAHVGASTGQLGGQAEGSVDVNAKCEPQHGKAPVTIPVAPIIMPRVHRVPAPTDTP